MDIRGPLAMNFGQDKAREELFEHGHKKCLIMSNGRQRNAKQTIHELISHYEFYHAEKNGKKIFS